MSDLHEADWRPVLAGIDAASPDAVLAGGDFVHNAEHYRRGIAFIRAAAAKYPTFCSLGNHELRLQGRIPELLEGSGAVLLDNAFTVFRGAAIGGLSSGQGNGVHRGRFAETAPPDDTAWLAEFSRMGGFRLLLCHHPEYYDRWIRPLPIDLTLSGHAHGGQWRFFGRGVFAPGQGVFPRYTSGLYDGGRLFVGRGIGNPHAVPRINNRPELILLRLEPDGAKQAGST